VTTGEVDAGTQTDILNPADVESTIWAVSNQIAKGVAVVSSAEQAASKARRVYDLAYAQSYLAASGPAHEKKYRAEIDTAQQRADAEIAEVAFEHAKRQMRALEGRLSAFQTISKSIIAMFGAAGHAGKGQ
jgi:hypothetical protein